MSTKTSIKRVALVAVAALTIGGFSAVSARATANTYIGGALGDGVSSYSLSNTTLSGVAGPANFVKIGFASTYAGIATVTGGTFGTSADTNVALNSAGTQATASGSQANGALVTVLTPTVGTITVNYYKQVSTGVYSSTVTESVVITVNATASSGVYSAAKSSVYITTGETGTPVAADATLTPFSSAAASAGDSATASVTLQVLYLDALGKGISLNTDSVTATITSGPGTINGTNDTTTVKSNSGSSGALANVASQYSKSVIPSQYGEADFVVWPNGQVGTSVITIKNAAGTVLGTKSIVFYSSTPASISATVLKNYVLNSTTATAKVFSVTVKDSGGNVISSPTVTAAAATGSTVGAAGSCSWNATDLVTYCSVAASTTQAALTTDASETYTFTAGTVTTTASVKFVSGTLSAITVSAPASADPGTKVVYTLTATGANGAPLPDGAYISGSIFTAADPSTNSALTAVPFGKGETITLVGGVATDYAYAPFAGTLSASWTLAGTAGAAQAVALSGDSLAFTAAGIVKTLTATTVAASDVAVNGSADSAAATDAANAATDAANAAADAADNATQAASEALAAVNSLATTVASLIAGIKAQITSLTNLITKIKNKVGA